MRPRLLDLFCGAGGAAMGYHRAGFDVVGVDIAPQPHYPFEFHQADAMTFPLDGFDAIHASPPCQAYSTLTSDRSKHPDLYGPTRSMLIAEGLPYVIENVIGAPYSHGIVLCGSMFQPDKTAEWVQRHRNFETSWLIFQPSCDHAGRPRPLTITGATSNGKPKAGRAYETAHSKKPDVRDFPRYMDMPWADPQEAALAIPPTYTEWIGRQLLDSHLSRV